MATWHQQQYPTKLYHETEWTVVIDPPNEYRAAPGQLNKIMMDEKANPRHVIESVRELRMTALPENQSSPANSDRFSIVINIGDEKLTFDKSIAIDPNDGVPQEATKPKLPKRKPKLIELDNDER
jgi:hypothetical protein